MEKYTRVYATVDLDAVRQNMAAMRGNISGKAGMIGVVKADGYGHGAIPIAKAIDSYVSGYAVATAEEGILLRRHGITKPVLILGMTHESKFEELLVHDIRPAVFQLEKAKILSGVAMRTGRAAKIHIAVDTGMNRIGLSPTESAADLVAVIGRLPGIEIEGMFTHFAKADEADKGAVNRQLALFLDFVRRLEERGVNIPVKHCSNSAGIIDLRQANMDMVRAGISIYGLYPSNDVDKNQVRLRPAMELKSFVTYVKTIPAGAQVSYGGTFEASSDTVVATIPVGYADGYPRNLSNRGDVLIRGRRARILGRVCMDQMMADVTGIPGVSEGDKVTLIGRDIDDAISVEELAAKGGGFHYEILCGVGKRVPRVYLESGSVVGAKDYFEDMYRDFCHESE